MKAFSNETLTLERKSRFARPLFQYGVALGGVVAAALLRIPFEGFLHGRAPYALYYVPILMTAWFCGVGPTVVAAVFSLFAVFWFAPTQEPGVLASFALYVPVVVAMVVLARAARAARVAAAKGGTDRALLAAIVDSSDDAIIAKNLDGIIQSCNASAERLFGYSAQELIGRPVTTLIPDDRKDEETAILAKLVRGERVDHFETVRVAKDGHFLDVSLTISPVRDRSGVIIGASKIARDITEKKRIIEQLAAQREWLRVTLSSIGDGVIACDVSGKINFLNGAAQKLTGWTTAEAEGRPLPEVFRAIDEKTKQPIENMVERVVESGKVLVIGNHTKLIRRDGSEVSITDSAAPIRDDRGSVIGVVLAFHDTSEQRKAVEALAEQREWLETTLESIGDAVIATDMHGLIVFMNPVAEKLTGWTSREAQGRQCSEVFRIVNEYSRKTVPNPIDRVLAEGTIVGLANHTVLIAADGTELPIDDSGAPIRNLAGRIVGAVLVFRDITERRQAEHERNDAAAEREKLLQSERAARTQAERASRAKDDFVAMVSHELRTPLNVILGWTKLLRDPHTSNGEMTERGLDIVERNTRLQAQLIDDLLDMSRAISGKLRLELRDVDLAAVIEDAIQTVQPAMDAKRVTIDRALDRSIGPFAGDAARLQQCVWNLLSNAVKFTSEGGRVRIELRRVGSQAEITVIDDGIGIRKELLPSIFERFHQGEAVTTRRYGGLGLGLAIVKELVQLHGGSVSAKSEGEGKGSTFTLSFPIRRLRADAAVVASEGKAELSLENVRVLLVEDDADTRDLVQRILEGHRAVVLATGSAREALRVLQQERPDVLVCDIGLPEVDGYELIEQIRESGVAAGGGVPALALTAYARVEDRTTALRAGFQAHIAKPVEPAELIVAVARLAANQRADQREA